MYECKFAEKLVALRLEKGVTQDELAQSLAVSNKTVSKWENGASMPDLPMLAALAAYFDVTTDALLGLSDDKIKDTGETVRSMLEGLDWRNSVLHVFAMEQAVIPALFGGVPDYKKEVNMTEDIYPTEYSHTYRSQFSTCDIFKYAASSEDNNFSVTLLRNKNNFAWLKDPEKQRKITGFFRFLSEADVLSVLYFILSADCTEAFTADYVSANTGIPVDRVSAILKQFCSVGKCSSRPAHLTEGDVDIYECGGDSMLLLAISLAYDRMCGSEAYNYNYSGKSKMIGGK